MSPGILVALATGLIVGTVITLAISFEVADRSITAAEDRGYADALDDVRAAGEQPPGVQAEMLTIDDLSYDDEWTDDEWTDELETVDGVDERYCPGTLLDGRCLSGHLHEPGIIYRHDAVILTTGGSAHIALGRENYTCPECGAADSYLHDDCPAGAPAAFAPELQLPVEIVREREADNRTVIRSGPLWHDGIREASGWQISDTGTFTPPAFLDPELVAAVPALGRDWTP